MQLIAAVKGGFVNRHVFRADPTQVRLALRDMAGALKDRKFWLSIVAVVLLVAVAGPFYTLDSLGLAARGAYWGTVGGLSWMMMWGLVNVALALAPGTWPRAMIGAIAGLGGVLPTMGLVAAANAISGMGLPGLREHRSWWFNLDHVERVRKSGNRRLELVLGNGSIVPVSRSRQAQLRRVLAEHGVPKA